MSACWVHPHTPFQVLFCLWTGRGIVCVVCVGLRFSFKIKYELLLYYFITGFEVYFIYCSLLLVVYCTLRKSYNVLLIFYGKGGYY